MPEIPKFEGKELVLRTEENSTNFSVTPSDGIQDAFRYGVYKNEKDNPATLLAQIIREIKKQGYKLTTSNNGSYHTVIVMVGYYIFEKD